MIINCDTCQCSTQCNKGPAEKPAFAPIEPNAMEAALGYLIKKLGDEEIAKFRLQRLTAPEIECLATRYGFELIAEREAATGKANSNGETPLPLPTVFGL